MNGNEARRLAALPGYDTAPDVYETPDLTDDTSTTIQTSPRSPVEGSDTSEEEEDEESFGVSRRRLYPERARSRFGATSKRVEVRNVDLSDRVDGKRKGYGVRRRGVEGDDEEEEEEGLEARIARLRREIEECRVEAERERQADVDGEEGGDVGQEVDGLGQLLAAIEVPRSQAARKREAQQRATTKGTSTDFVGEDEEVSAEQPLARVAAFDMRLAALEQALGISSLDSAMADAVSTPVLPSLTLLDQQLSALASASSLTNLEAASGRIQKLKHEAGQLSQAQSRGGAAVNGDATDDLMTPISQEDLEKLHSLYTLLPTLQSLAPTVPAILSRLRSLLTLHSSAAEAANELDDVEKRQAEMDRELMDWKAALEKVEGAVGEASEANGRNGKVVENWVRELEGRMKGLGR